MPLSGVRPLNYDNNSENQEFVELFQSHEAFLVAVAFRFAPRPDLVPDIVQQTFVRFMERALQKPWNLEIETKPLLYSIAKSVALDHWRRYQQESPEALVRIGRHLSRIQAENEHKEATYERNTRRVEALKECREKLPTDSAILLEEHYDRGISISDMAKKRNINTARLRMVFFRLRAKLKDCIQKKLHERNA